MRTLLLRSINFKHLRKIPQKWFCSVLAAAFSNLPVPALPLSKSPTVRREFANLLQNTIFINSRSDHKIVHCQIVVSGYQYDIFICNVLLNVYAKLGDTFSARNMFDTMRVRNLVSWSTVVSMYMQHGFYENGLMFFMEFWRTYDYGPNEYMLASVIRACTQLGGASWGSFVIQIHGFLVKSGFELDVFVGTSLIDFYAKNNELEVARQVFDSLTYKTAVTWTTMMTGYARSGQSEVSLDLFNKMRRTNVLPDRYILSSVLSACSLLAYVGGGKQVHCYLLRRGTEVDSSVINVLIDFYVKCCRVKSARHLFDSMLDRNSISWTTMIAGYMQNSLDKEALALFAEMPLLGFQPDMFACTSVLTSCGSLKALEQGKQAHAYVIKANLESDRFVRNSLVDMYTKCSCFANARRVFDLKTVDNTVSYNAMIEGYSRADMLFEALELFHGMRVKPLQPSQLTFVSLLGLCASLCNLKLSREIHGLMLKYGYCLDLFAGSALVDAYSKCSSIEDARIIFEKMDEKDVVVWNAMFSGYVQQLDNEESLKLYLELKRQGERPDEFSFSSLVTAASNLASLNHGMQFHCQVIKVGLESNTYVKNALVDMYANCGSSGEALKTFSSTACSDVVCWNSLISCYAHNGEAEKAIEMFERMIAEGINPNYVTFVGVLSACNHAGLVECGLVHFNSMSHFGIEPGTEHYACIVSLLGRAGKIYEALDYIRNMPSKPSALIWRSLLSACRDSSDLELAKQAAEMAIEMDPRDSGSFVMLSNIYASKGMWGDVRKVRNKMDSHGVTKEAGRSWVEVGNKVHAFVAKENDHVDKGQIYQTLNELNLQIKSSSTLQDGQRIQMDG